MREVGVLEAKTNFSSLIAAVAESGEEVTVTRHGRPVVRIVPAYTRRIAGPETADRIRAMRRQAESPNSSAFDLDAEIRAIRDGDG